MRLVEEVHKEISKFVRSGDFAIDATLGNGYDTLLLAKCGAKVIGFDIQGLAIENTRDRLLEEGCLVLDQVTLYKEGHERMLEKVPKDWIGKVRIVMFNLGYLPGGDKSVITRRTTTIQALESAYRLLGDGGYLSIVLYPDHEGGEDEASGVKTWIAKMGNVIKYLRPGVNRGPEWYLIQKS